MKKEYFLSLMLGVMLISGCASTSQYEIYPMSYDQAYQTSLDALNEVGQWKVLETDQLNGLIVLEKGGYFMPRRTAKVKIQRLEPFRTRVELSKESSEGTQRKFFEAIDRRVENRALTYPS